MALVTTNGHAGPATRAETRATDARLAVIEQRLTQIANATEERTSVLRDASADFIAAELAARYQEIAALKSEIAELRTRIDQQAAADRQVTDVTAKLNAWQSARDESKEAHKANAASADNAASQAHKVRAVLLGRLPIRPSRSAVGTLTVKRTGSFRSL